VNQQASVSGLRSFADSRHLLPQEEGTIASAFFDACMKDVSNPRFILKAFSRSLREKPARATATN
jgi:hypothetical protein